jgi:Ca-activated chloride channel family protein
MYRMMLVLWVLALPGCSRVAPPETQRDPNIVFEGALERRVLPAGEQVKEHARVRIGVRDPGSSEDAPVNVAMVIDTSGSMKGEPIVEARKAALALLDALADDDRLAVITFHSKTDVLLESTPLDDDAREQARKGIESMRALGTTDMAGGVQAAIDQVNAHFDPRGINRVVLLGDGVPNQEGALRAMAQSAGQRGITITSLGLGEDYDETLMGAMAQLSGGRFHYVESAEKVVAFFKNEALRLDGVYARNAVLELTPGPGVEIEDVIGHVVQRDSVVSVGLGDMSRDEARDVFVKLNVRAHRAGAPVELLDAVLRYDDPLDSSIRKERRLYFGANASAITADIDRGRDRVVEAGLARAVAAAETLKAIELARQGDGAGASTRLSLAMAEARNKSKEHDAPELKKQVKAMEKLQRALESGQKVSDAAVREATPGLPPPGASVQPSPAPQAGQYEYSSPAKRAIRSAHDESMQVVQ